MEQKRIILIVDDDEVNRNILTRILIDEYDVISAENGKIALDLIAKNFANIAAIILDLKMPVLDGYGVLENIRAEKNYENIPIVVATVSNDKENEERALGLGCWDFVTKPYEPKIIKFRIKNAIERSKLHLLEQLRYYAEHDALTGLYNSRKFIQIAQKMIGDNISEKFAIIRFDVEHFSQFNSLYGEEAGDKFLKFIADKLQDSFSSIYLHQVFARIESDVFAICTNYTAKEKLNERISEFQQQLKSYSQKFDIVTTFGIYYVSSVTLPVNEMIDYAAIAAKAGKGKYDDTITVFDEKMEEEKNNNRQIVSEMKDALATGQFCVYYQPKYNIKTDTPCGSEALVRWNHPTRGLISPGVFIPTFEKNGFIAQVDYYVWETVCKDLRRWIDENRTPSPVSVNISRANLNNPNIVDIFVELVEKYNIAPSMFQLEITESAYMENPSIMKSVVKSLQDKGFTILMDDFGSGYSSLNTLKEIPVDILKIDMKFVPSDDTNIRSEKILSSVVRMAHWLDMPCIVEGVETRSQKDFLSSIGIVYAQGYYYSKPLPVKEFEELMSSYKCQDSSSNPVYKHTKELDNLLSSSPSTQAILSSVSVPMAFFEYSQSRLELIRANNSYFDIFGFDFYDESTRIKLSPTEQTNIQDACSKVVSTRSSYKTDALYLSATSEAFWFRINAKYIMPSPNGHIICIIYTDITEEKKANMEICRISNILDSEQKALKNRAMLIVDDAEIDREILKSVFKDEFNILCAKDGIEALNLLQSHKDQIAIILLDIVMPNMNGYEFLEQKNKLEGSKRVPVIVVSADSSEELQINMLESGVNDYVIKPFVPQVVYHKVQNVMEYQNRFSQLINEFKKETQKNS